MSLTCEELLQKHAVTWQQAILHPFLEQCQSGTIQPQQFNTWLLQDYLFVIEFTRLVARTLASAPPEHFELILGGLSALKNELTWFKAKAAERQLNLESAKQDTCIKYCNFLEQVANQPYPVQATSLWAIERAYNQAWQLPGSMSKPYAEFAERWGNPDFSKYVKGLEQQANEVLSTTSEKIQAQAESAFLEIARLEKDFWQMAFTA